METRAWELGILSALVQNTQYIRHYSEAIAGRHFSYPYAPKYLKILQRVWDKWGRMPTMPEMQHLCQVLASSENIKDPEILKRMARDVKFLYKQEVTEVTRDEIEKFIVGRELEVFKSKFDQVDLDKREEFLAELNTRTNKLQRLGGMGHELRITYVLEPETIDRVEEDNRLVATGVRSLTTGFPRADALFGGGTEYGEFGAFLGPSGRGKTASLVHVGVANLLQGKRVLHVSCDEPEMQILRRYLIRLTGIPRSAMLKPGKLKKICEKMFPGLLRNLIVVSAPTESISTKDIARIVERIQGDNYHYDIQQGISPEEAGRTHLIITDYATKLRGWMNKSRNMETWDVIRYRSEEHQWLAQEMNAAVWSAFQGNKEMWKSEIGQLHQIAQGIGAVNALTTAFVIGMLQEDLHTDPLKLYYYAAKTRTENSLFLVPTLYTKSKQLIVEDMDEDISYVASTVRDGRPKETEQSVVSRNKSRKKARVVKENPNFDPDADTEDEDRPTERKGRGKKR